MTELLRFKDLRERGIVRNRTSLGRWIEKHGFPRGRLLGPNSRVWTAEEIEAWLAERPVEREQEAAAS